MVGLGEAVFYFVDVAGTIEGMAPEVCRGSLTILRRGGELDAVVGEYSMDAVRNAFDERLEEGRGLLAH
jgi:hypothetical protein